MAKLRLEIITAERVVFSEDVDVVIAPGIEGELGILPHHASLLTMLQVGELRARKEGEEVSMFISGGFLEVLGDRVVVLADTCERAEEIDTARAEEAKQRAEQVLELRPVDIDAARAEGALRRSLTRLKIAQRRKRRG